MRDCHERLREAVVSASAVRGASLREHRKSGVWVGVTGRSAKGVRVGRFDAGVFRRGFAWYFVACF